MRDELRTGWLVRPGNVGELARAVGAALALDVTAYEALGARARQFAEFMFSPQSVAEAMRGVYTSLLARDDLTSMRIRGRKTVMSSLPAPGTPAIKNRTSMTARGAASEPARQAARAGARDPITMLIAVPTLDAGAADTGAVELVRILTAAGHRAIVASQPGRLVADVTAAGGEFVALDVASNNPIVMLRNAAALNRLAREHKCDAIHALGRAGAWSAFSPRGCAAFRS